MNVCDGYKYKTKHKFLVILMEGQSIVVGNIHLELKKMNVKYILFYNTQF
jgi:hypothetical protein